VKPKSKAKAVVWARRVTQMACLALFFFLFYSVHYVKDVPPSPRLKFFFDLDPLVAFGTWLSSRTLPSVPWLAIVAICATILLGRVFCGWVCPFGTVNNIFSWLRKHLRGTPFHRDGWTRWQRGKYYFLTAFIVMSAFGAHWFGIFDPISLLSRATAITLYPGVQYAVENSATGVYDADPHVGALHLTSLTEPAYRFLRDNFFKQELQGFYGGTLILILFATILLLNLLKNRFWCRYVCPLGALLGICSQRPVMRLTQGAGCTGCGRCSSRCPAAANPDRPGDWRSTECFACYNCVAACNRNVIDFEFASPFPSPSSAKFDLSKRALLAAGVGGVAGLASFRLSPQTHGRVYSPALIRPPGSRDERAFLQRCLQCGVCMKACPTNGLQPTLFEAGLEGVWTPMLKPSIGYCEYNCNLCGQVCPTQAIQPLALEEKRKVKLGLATFDTTRCLPYAYNRECMICEEHCPTPKKAIFFTPREVTTRTGATITLKQPHVDPDLCIGCGTCENVCVFKDRPAIRVTSANETRHPGNRPILAGFSDAEAVPENSTPAETSSDAQSQSNPYGS
jgi:polyferredoxin